MKRIAVFVAVLSAGIGVTATGQTETLTYFGEPFTTLNIEGDINSGSANRPTENTGQIVLATPLTNNLENFFATPLSWSFDTGSQLGSFYLNSDSADPAGASFEFSTDSTGKLTAWNIYVAGAITDGTNSPSFASASITSTGDSYSSGLSTPTCAAPPGVPVPCYDLSESNSDAGHWTQSVARAPELNPTFAAGALTLLLGTVTVFRRRRPRQA